MARKTRVCYPGAIYHVMARGNERARIFQGKKDYELFLKSLREALGQFEVVLHAYCLMPNHTHLAVETPQGNLPRFMAWLQTTFTVRYNRTHGRSGHLFQGRYRAELVDGAVYGKWLVMYIHLNPARSRAGGGVHYTGGLEDLNEFKWSSHPDYAGLRPTAKELDLGWLAEWGNTLTGAHKGYLREIQRQLGDDSPLDWKERVRMGLVAGGDELVRRAKKLLKNKGREVGREEVRRIQQGSRKEKLAESLAAENDFRNRIWIRVRLLGESQVQLAKERGYGSSAAIHQIAKRVEQRADRNAALGKKLKAWKALLNVID